MSTKTLNPNAQKWVEALESGEFKQGQNWLTVNDTHCCLGVACIVAMRNGVELEVTTDGEQKCYDQSAIVLPDKVRDWLGLKSNASYFMSPAGEGEQLTALNDTGVTFAELSAIIRSQPEGLFEES